MLFPAQTVNSTPFHIYSKLGISSSSESPFSRSSPKLSKLGLPAAPEFKLANISCILPNPPASAGPSSLNKIYIYTSNISFLSYAKDFVGSIEITELTVFHIGFLITPFIKIGFQEMWFLFVVCQ